MKKSVKIAVDGDDAPVSGNKKKSVSFKTTLETSDDRSVVKKVWNPDTKGPLVPIIKRKCLNRLNGLAGSGGKSTCIVRPSRLTDVLKNGSGGGENVAVAATATPTTTTIIKASLFSAASALGGTTGATEHRSHESSPRKSLYSSRIIKANKRLMGYSRDYLKKLKKSIDGKAKDATLEDVQGGK